MWQDNKTKDCAERTDKSASHLGGNIAMIQLYNGQIQKQLHKDKDCIQYHQTHHYDLKATSDNQKEGTLLV